MRNLRIETSSKVVILEVKHREAGEEVSNEDADAKWAVKVSESHQIDGEPRQFADEGNKSMEVVFHLKTESIFPPLVNWGAWTQHFGCVRSKSANSIFRTMTHSREEDEQQA